MQPFLSEFKTLSQLKREIRNVSQAREYLKRRRYGRKPFCTHCKSTDINYNKPHEWTCKQCGYHVSFADDSVFYKARNVHRRLYMIWCVLYATLSYEQCVKLYGSKSGQYSSLKGFYEAYLILCLNTRIGIAPFENPTGYRKGAYLHTKGIGSLLNWRAGITNCNEEDLQLDIPPAPKMEVMLPVAPPVVQEQPKERELSWLDNAEAAISKAVKEKKAKEEKCSELLLNNIKVQSITIKKDEDAVTITVEGGDNVLTINSNFMRIVL